VHHGGGIDLIEEPLRQLETEFPGRFVRIHRSLLVAVAAIEALEKDSAGGYHVRLRGDEAELPVSRRQVAELKARLTTGR
jgi:two-component system response regulator AlgR